MHTRLAQGVLPATLVVAFSALSGALYEFPPDPAGLGVALASALLYFQIMNSPAGRSLGFRLAASAAALCAASALALADEVIPSSAATGLSITASVVFLVFARSLSMIDSPRLARTLSVILVSVLLLDGILLSSFPAWSNRTGSAPGVLDGLGFDPVAVSAYLLAFICGFRSGWINHLGTRGRWAVLGVSVPVSILSTVAASAGPGEGPSSAVAGFALLMLVTGTVMLDASSLAILVSLPSSGALERTRRDLSAVQEIGDLILSGAGGDLVCERAAALVRRLRGVDAAWIELLDASGSSSIVQVSGTDLIEAGLPGCGIGGWIREEDPAAAGGPKILSGLPPGSPLSRLSSAGLGIRSLIHAPIRAGGVDLGSLVAVSGSPFAFVEQSTVLLDSFAGLVGVALLNSRLLSENIEKARYQEEMEIARSIQEGLLEVSLPSMPPFRAAAYSRPSMEVGGDCYDISELPGGGIGIFMADVAGKGAGAAILMSAVHAATVTLLREGYGPDRTAAAVNHLLCRISPDDRFVTFFCAVLDRVAGSFSYCNAGHDPPLLVRRGASGEAVELSTGGLVLGVTEAASYESACIGMEAGDTLVLYTDGLTDRIGRFEEDARGWMAGLVRDHCGAAPERLLERLVTGSETSEPDGPDDDVTVLVISKAC